MMRKSVILCFLLLVVWSQPGAETGWAQTPVTTPVGPCTVLGYAVSNYFVPPNDYLLVPINGTSGISIPLATACTLNSVTITFQGAPSVPLLVWLTDNATTPGTTSTPVYVNGSSLTVPKSFFGTGTTTPNWFALGQNWKGLAIQAIYPNPPPSTFYYPESCTILFQ